MISQEIRELIEHTDLTLKGGPGSGNWEGPGNPRFQRMRIGKEESKSPLEMDEKGIDNLSSNNKKLRDYFEETLNIDNPSELRKRQVENRLYDKLKDNKDFIEGVNPEGIGVEGDVRLRIRQLIDNWANTSGDSDRDAITMQQTAKELFGLGDSSMKHLGKGRDFLKEKKGLKAFLKAQYDNTQEFLKARGITEVLVHRGVLGNRQGYENGEESMVLTQPLSSFSIDPKQGYLFAVMGKNPTVISTVIPVSRIFSVPGTGFGCLNEREVVIVGDKVKGSSMSGVDNFTKAEISRTFLHDPSDINNPKNFVASVKTYFETISKKKGIKIIDIPNIDEDIEDADWPKRTKDVLLNELYKDKKIKSLPSTILAKALDIEVSFDKAKWDKKINKTILPMLKEIIDVNGKATMDELSKMVKPVQKGIKTKADEYDPLLEDLINFQLRFDVLSPEVLQYIKDRAYKFSFDMNEFTEGLLKEELVLAFEMGESISKIKERVKTIFGFSDTVEGNYRAKRIARSEMIRASNYGVITGYKQAGDIVVGKEWVTALDERTCPACSAMNGKIIGVDKLFFKKGETFSFSDLEGLGKKLSMKMDYEAIGAPPLHVNCRCTIIPVVKEIYKGILQKGGPGSGNWEGPADPRFARTSGGKVLSQEDFFIGEYGRTEGGTSANNSSAVAKNLAKKWDVSFDTIKTLVKEDSGEKDWERIKAHSYERLKDGFVNGILGRWEGSSGGVIPEVMIGHVANRLKLQYKDDIYNKWMNEHKDVKKSLHSLADVMYGDTQKFFIDRGIKRITLYRGEPQSSKDKLYSSWTINPGHIRIDEYRKKRKEVVDVKYIFSTPATGFGTYAESEIVVLPRMHKISK